MIDRYNGKKVVVTGADGFIGSHLVEMLVRSGAAVTALAHYNAFGHCGWLDDLNQDTLNKVNIRNGDVRDSFFVHNLIQDQQVVFHLAALIAIPYSYIAPQSYIDVNVTGTLNVLEAARNSGAERVVHTSTSEVYGSAQTSSISEEHPLHGQSPYAASKIGADMLAESYFRSFDLPVVILRPFNTFGPRQSERAVIPSVVRQAIDPTCKEIRIGSTEPKRDFNYVADTTKAFLLAGSEPMLKFGTAYNAGSGTAITIGEMIASVQEITGVNKPIAQEADRIRPPKSEVMELIASSNKFFEKTEWRNDVDFKSGLQLSIDWWRTRISDGRVRRNSSYQI